MELIFQKKDGTFANFDSTKIEEAVNKACKQVNIVDAPLSRRVAAIVEADAKAKFKLDSTPLSRAWIQRQVKEALILMDATDVAIEYIEYAARRDKPDIFKPRENVLPYEYPQMMDYVNAIRHSFWLHTHYDYTNDVSTYYNPNTNPHWKTVYTRCLLAISQIEVTVKSYWKNIDTLFPKHEFSMVAGTHDGNESIHFDTYRNLLELVGLNSEFGKLNEYPVLKERSDSLKQAVAITSNSRRDILFKNIMFSSFIENVSLFSQFAILAEFNRSEKVFTGTYNGIMSTSKDELTHWLTGVEISNIIIKENPEIWTEEFKQEIVKRSEKALETEYALIDWLFDNQDLEFLTMEEVKSFVTLRMQMSLEAIGIDFPLSPMILRLAEKFDYFDAGSKVLTKTDFFAYKDTGYSKGTRSYDVSSVFGTDFIKELEKLNVY